MFERKIGRNLEALKLEAKVFLYSVGIWLLLLVLAIIDAGICYRGRLLWKSRRKWPFLKGTSTNGEYRIGKKENVHV